jgi:hypothetical protein
MPFDWKTFVDLARQLEQQANAASSPNAETLQRSAVSRAYFGAYCHARNYAISFLKFASRQDVDDHGRLRAHLKNKRRQADASRLDRLRQWRNIADYSDDLPWKDVKAVVIEAIEEAEKVFASLLPPSATSGS